ncbi:dipeptidyl aminopeptidase/acylaminoacyl peptidase [Bacillus oleivorans]|uniref:Dipeptidyl aminopeptidase/acylaminoacyl peptidase n=1 Tax=Bacillus oleivorans TaxID=1448271 RepID=A0A285D2I5_9BACI|nr:S9 family peptidase [Bacillus oleivorans]SNX74024.1 dipeptidyl aminopeptidase/acylaminoacyl peptidase [Bacillus oleivorans]
MIKFPKPDVEQFFRTLLIQDFTVRPDEKQLVFSTNLSGHYNLWAMDLPNQFPYQLTFKDQSAQALHYAKTGDFIIVGFDQDGDENTQLYALQPHGGELVPVRVQEKERHFLASVSKDGKRLYYTGTKYNPRFLNSYVYSLETGEEKMILEGKEAPTFIAAVSPDESSLVYVKNYGNTYSLAYVHTNNGDLLLTPETAEQHTVSQLVYTSENEIYFLTDYDADLSYLAKFNLETKEFSKVLEVEGEDFSDVKYSKKDNLLYLVGSYGVEDRLYQYDLAGGKLTQLKAPTSVIVKAAIMDSGNLYLLGRDATRPFNIFKSTDRGSTWEELTHYRVPGVKDEDLVEPEVLRYPSFDGLEIEALFFRAKKENSNGHVILWPHGGPQSLERKWFRARFQFLVNRGYSIFAPNFRGSSNYGLTFMKMVEGDWGHGPRLDNIEGLEWLIKNGYADRDKILLMGGSYGGYMALLLHGRHADYFKAVVDIFGVSNLFSFYESVPEFWKPFMNQWVGDPVKDKDKLTEDSPITHLDGMVKPMLVIQGANDPRVVKAESDQVVDALRAKGRDVEYLVLEDEGHGFSKKENEIKVDRKILEFFERFAD